MKENTIITTFDGTTANKKDCRFIKGEFYIKNKQCFNIGGTWYRINSGFIAYNYSTREWVLLADHQNLIRGIVDYDNEAEEVVIGHFTSDPLFSVDVVMHNGTVYKCMNYNILPKDVFKEDIGAMRFYHISSNYTPSKNIPKVTFANNNYGFELPYGVRNYPQDIKEKIISKSNEYVSKRARSNNDTNIANYAHEFVKLGNYSFGFEFETSMGKVPGYKLTECGLLPLRDGSITGIEYATIPLSGMNGIKMLTDVCNNLKRYTTFTMNESLHLHIGNIPVTKKFVAYLYTICCILENEIYSIFPRYYAQTSKFKVRQKDYNLPLKKEFVSSNPMETFDNVSFFLSAGNKYQGFGSAHPLDQRGDHKWQIDQRYYWVNFIPLMFGDNKTIEFRCHVPTNDPIKVINWLYICSAIVKYADMLSKKDAVLLEQKSLTLDKVLDNVYSNKLSTYLKNYIKARKTNRILDDQSSSFCGEKEISQETSKHYTGMYSDIVG